MLIVEVREWSSTLRSDIETLVRSACTDLTNHWKKTNSALKDNVNISQRIFQSFNVVRVVSINFICIRIKLVFLNHISKMLNWSHPPPPLMMAQI